MSVINKMLLDLDKRNGRPGGEAVPGDAIRSTKPSTAWGARRGVLILLTGLAAASVCGAWWTQHGATKVSSSLSGAVSPVPTVATRTLSPAGPVASPAAIASMPTPQHSAAERAAASIPASKSLGTTADAAVVATPDASKASKVSSKALAVTVSPKALQAVEIATLAGAAKAFPSAASKGTSASAPAPARDLAEGSETGRPASTAAPASKTTSAKTYSPMQMSTNLLAEAVRLDQQGHLEEAKASLRRALATNPLDVQARQMLVRLQIDTGRLDEAASLLIEGRRLHPDLPEFTLTLARLRADSGDDVGAIQLLQEGAAAARDEPQYHALLAALLLRSQRYAEAVQHYLVALRSDPGNARWLVGVGAALEAVGDYLNAGEAYRRAEATSRLPPEMAPFVSQRLSSLSNLRAVERTAIATTPSAHAPE